MLIFPWLENNHILILQFWTTKMCRFSMCSESIIPLTNWWCLGKYAHLFGLVRVHMCVYMSVCLSLSRGISVSILITVLYMCLSSSPFITIIVGCFAICRFESHLMNTSRTDRIRPPFTACTHKFILLNFNFAITSSVWMLCVCLHVRACVRERAVVVGVLQRWPQKSIRLLYQTIAPTECHLVDDLMIELTAWFTQRPKWVCDCHVYSLIRKTIRNRLINGAMGSKMGQFVSIIDISSKQVT